jgi:hypothetical protein
VDAQTGAFGEHQELGVEEPAGVLDHRQQAVALWPPYARPVPYL